MLKYILAAAALITPAAVASQSEDPALSTVQGLDDGLLAIMKSGRAAGVAGRAAKIAPVVDRAFDLPLMTRLVVGTPWNGMAPADQVALIAAFRRTTVEQYARNFDTWSGEAFKIAPQVEQRAGDKLVRTTLTDAGAGTAISYRLRQHDGQWKIIDVFYKNAISQLATRRADFAAILASGGPKALIAHLDRLSKTSGN